jgi:hypothetical protein
MSLHELESLNEEERKRYEDLINSEKYLTPRKTSHWGVGKRKRSGYFKEYNRRRKEDKSG